jgi:hypothetical protein
MFSPSAVALGHNIYNISPGTGLNALASQLGNA